MNLGSPGAPAPNSRTPDRPSSAYQGGSPLPPPKSPGYKDDLAQEGAGCPTYSLSGSGSACDVHAGSRSPRITRTDPKEREDGRFSPPPAFPYQFPGTTGSSPSDSSGSNGCSHSARQSVAATWQRTSTAVKSLTKVVRHAPMTLVLPILVFACLAAAGESALWGAHQGFIDDRATLTASTATKTVQQIELLLQSWIAPVITLAAVIKRTPDVPSLVEDLPTILTPIRSLMDPDNASVRLLIYPWLINQGYQGSSVRSLGLVNTNLFVSSAYKNSFKQFASMPADYTDVWGPVTLMDGTYGFVTRFNIWLASPGNPNETWGMDKPYVASWAPEIPMGNFSWQQQSALCGGSCDARQSADGTPLVYWGMASNVMEPFPLTRLLDTLSDRSLQSVPFNYVLLRKVDANLNDPALLLDTNTLDAGTRVIYRTPGLDNLNTAGHSGSCVDMGTNLSVNMTWTLCLAPMDGWQPAWLIPMAVLIPILSLVVAILVFFLMASQEKHRMLVEAILPPKVIQQLGLGNVYMENFQSVTALFSDIVSYTTISSELSPPELVRLLDELYSAFDQLVDKHGLHKVETIGDAFFCVGGAPNPCKPLDAARRVALMALDMVEFVDNFRSKHKIRIRIGLYTGDVTAAVMGSKVPHWALVGDTINVTARMETNSAPQSINIGPTTAALLATCPEFALEPRGELDIKGKGPMRCYWLRAARKLGPAPSLKPDASQLQRQQQRQQQELRQSAPSPTTTDGVHTAALMPAPAPMPGLSRPPLPPVETGDVRLQPSSPTSQDSQRSMLGWATGSS